MVYFRSLYCTVLYSISWWMQDWNIHYDGLHQCYRLLHERISEQKMCLVWT